jgi:hypothetical protein
MAPLIEPPLAWTVALLVRPPPTPPLVCVKTPPDISAPPLS